MIPWWSTEFGAPEIANVTAAIEGRHISQGKITRQFEEALAETLGVPYVVCTTSGTTALTMALLAVGVGPGDEVIVPNRTWIATAHAVMMTGAKVRLIDVCPNEASLYFESIQEWASFKAIVPVWLNGRVRPFHRSENFISPLIVEDSCQAFPNPPRGDIACYSLSTAKIIATGQGGFCATKDEALYKELKALRTHDVEDAMVPQVLQWRRFGYNFRFTDIQAAIGLAQLKRLPARLEALQEIHQTYKEFGVPVLDSPTPLYNELLHPDPERLRAYLLPKEIEARPFYPSINTAPYLNDRRRFPNSEKFEKGLFLPSGPNQKIADIKKVCEAYHDFR